MGYKVYKQEKNMWNQRRVSGRLKKWAYLHNTEEDSHERTWWGSGGAMFKTQWENCLYKGENIMYA